ncbi:type II toxin-antitoxin system tRNA(fMet)-specific endonuclease VapC [Ningiella sp. W23]|uniref:type II toxin-antitoxin system tRNA(fMet)-specific endonuclease VapC n=1 Tax=Ningiella sp. W23 TaxID=3023715 RepID=UPI003756682D
MLKYMLDTDMAIFTIKRKPTHIRRLFNAHIGQLCISAVTWGELICGAEKSQQVGRNLADLQGFSARLEILPFDEQASNHFGQLKAELELKGNKIGGYDMMIAGHARSKGLILITNNIREFKRVEGLRIENWVEQA